jgi:hypothetical protein
MLWITNNNRLRLHGCNVTKYQNNDTKHRYPWCEKYDMEEIELEFDALLKNNNLSYRSGDSSSTFVWNKVGGCKRFDDQIRNGKDWNGRLFDGNCTIDVVDPSKKAFFKKGIMM